MKDSFSDVPVSISTIEYDFEEYALNYGIPETLDPLPYRKAGSVFASGDEAEPILTSAKHDPRLRTVVCRHWLRDLCMKGAACEFLHQYDLSKMPLCRHGERCKIRDCPFRHISEENRMECAFYKSGFCIHGPFCRYKHAKRPREDIPAVADFTLGLSQMQAGKEAVGGTSTKRPAPKPNEFYKISLCKHYAAGDCPFGEGCHFAHGEHELRTFPRKNEGGSGYNEDGTSVDGGDNGGGGAGGGELSDHMFTVVPDTTIFDYFQGGAAAAGGGKPCPIIDAEKAFYFLIVAATQDDLAISTVRKEWYVQRKDADSINAAYLDAVGGSKRQVMIFFTVSNSRHIQGAALVTKAATYNEKVIETLKTNKQLLPNQRNKYITNNNNNEEIDDDDDDDDDDDETLVCYRIGIEWYRTTEFPLKTAIEITQSEIVLPSKDQHCVNISWKHGNTLMKAVWNSPLLALYESWEEDDGDIPAPENILTDFRAPGGLRSIDENGIPIPMQNDHDDDDNYDDDDNNNNNNNYDNIPSTTSLSWPTMPGPGFIFGCSSDTMDECLGRGIFGLPAHMKPVASNIIVPGATIFLFNVTDRLLFGIFEALTTPRMNIVPTAFSKNPKATTSPFPVQIRVRVSLECPPLEDTDPILNDILRTRGVGKGRIGPLSHAQTVAVASLLANQCGALQYMQEYQTGIRQGSVVRPPPIALPPRKIVISNKKVNNSNSTSIKNDDDHNNNNNNNKKNNNNDDDNKNNIHHDDDTPMKGMQSITNADIDMLL